MNLQNVTNLLYHYDETGSVLRYAKKKELNITSLISEMTLSALVVPHELKEQIDKIIFEYRQRDQILCHGLENIRKILFTGPRGSGKIMTAHILSNTLNLTLNRITLKDILKNRSAKTFMTVEKIFKLINQTDDEIFLFEDIDAIEFECEFENEEGDNFREGIEYFFDFLEKDKSTNLLIITQNDEKIKPIGEVYNAVFDDVLLYEFPDKDCQERLIRNTLGIFLQEETSINDVLIDDSEKFYFHKLTSAEIVKKCKNAIKYALFKNKKIVDCSILKMVGLGKE